MVSGKDIAEHSLYFNPSNGLSSGHEPWKLLSFFNDEDRILNPFSERKDAPSLTYTIADRAERLVLL